MWLIVATGIFILACAIAILYSKDRNKPNHDDQKDQRPMYKIRADFRVVNYLPKHSVKVSVSDPDGSNQVILVDKIQPLKSGGISKEIVEKHLKPGSLLKVHTIDRSGRVEPYTSYIIDHSCYERLKNLHIGMITTRFIGKSTDGLRMSTLADNAIQGHSWLVIHNLTEKTLRLNDDIVVAPHSTERYLGYLHQGVTLGTIFKDQDGLYPDFQYLNPHTDLYYGVVSDLKQPLYGPFQLEFSDDCDTDQTLWPFELGQM